MYKAVVIGVSAGGMEALKVVLPALPASFPMPVIIVQHVAAASNSYLVEYLDRLGAVTIKEAEDKESINPGTVYIAPPGYHLLVEMERTLSLSIDPKVHFSCPSIDVLFESAAEAFGDTLVGIVLTGANCDGSAGLEKIKARGGLAIVQNPKTAQAPYMPQAALNIVRADYVVDLDQIAPLLIRLGKMPEGESHDTGTHCRKRRF